MKDIYRPWGGHFPNPELEQIETEQQRVEKLREDPLLRQFFLDLDMQDVKPI